MTLRPYQQKAHDDAVNHLRTTQGNGIVVMATGSGKSHCIAALAEHVFSKGGDALVLAHRKELLAQNASKFSNPEYVGIYSAGLGERELDKPIIIGGIQSIYNKELVRPPRLIIVDECHLVPNKEDGGTMYWQLLSRYPDARIMGYTATPYRTADGKLSWGDICHVTNYGELCPEFLAPLTYKLPKAHIDTSNVKIRLGDFAANELEEEAIKHVQATMKSLLAYGDDRDSWLIFGCGVKHAEALRWALSANGIASDFITGDTPPTSRAKIITEFKDKKIRALVNCDVLTTGFDAPNVDLICVARPTMSPGLHEQILGRGTRQAEYKENCLIIDMAWNTIEHGKLGEIDWHKMKSHKLEANKYKACPECEAPVRVAAKSCPDCNYEWPAAEEEGRKIQHKMEALGHEKLEAVESWYHVVSRDYSYTLSKKNQTPMMKVRYNCKDEQGYDMATFYEYICLAHTGYAQSKAYSWLRNNLVDDNDRAVIRQVESGEDRVTLAIQKEYKTPSRILVKEQPKKFPEIMEHDFSRPEAAMAEAIEDGAYCFDDDIDFED